MLLPQSSAFAALKNRLNSVSAIGYLHIPTRVAPPTTPAPYDRPNRLKGREEGVIRWADLLEKFKSVQERSRRAKGPQFRYDDRTSASVSTMGTTKEKVLPEIPKPPIRPASAEGMAPRVPVPQHKQKSSLGNFGRLARGVGGSKTKK